MATDADYWAADMRLPPSPCCFSSATQTLPRNLPHTQRKTFTCERLRQRYFKATTTSFFHSQKECHLITRRCSVSVLPTVWADQHQLAHRASLLSSKDICQEMAHGPQHSTLPQRPLCSPSSSEAPFLFPVTSTAPILP